MSDRSLSRVVAAFVARLGVDDEQLRDAAHAALDVALDELAASAPRPRRAGRRPPAQPDNDVPVDDLARRRAEQALGRKGIR